jgi:hypothetical protein
MYVVHTHVHLTVNSKHDVVTVAVIHISDLATEIWLSHAPKIN